MLACPTFLGSTPPEAAFARGRHIVDAFLARMVACSMLALPVRVTRTKGMIVLRSETEAAVRSEIEADPGVRARIFTFDLNDLFPFYSGDVGSTPGK